MQLGDQRRAFSQLSCCWLLQAVANLIRNAISLRRQAADFMNGMCACVNSCCGASAGNQAAKAGVQKAVMCVRFRKVKT